MLWRLGAGAALVLAATVASGQEKPKVDLVYRWDELAGKVAVYDVEVVSDVIVDRQLSNQQQGEADEDMSADKAPTRLEGTTTTKQRVTMTFARGERDRGRITVAVERLALKVVQKAGGTTETVTYDSEKPGAEIPDKVKATVQAILRKPYTLVVTRRGLVESVEGRPRSELESLKATFLLLPDTPRAEGETWTRTKRDDAGPLGDIVTRFEYRLAKVVEGEKPERRIETKIATSLDDSDSKLPPDAAARIENPKGEGKIVLDARGLKLEEEERSSYELTFKQVTMTQRNKLDSKTTWKLVEVKDAPK